jgi:bifunctional non-homologous end joining protein LigD
MGSGWLYEVKLDGYRLQAHLVDDRCRLLTKRGHDWTDRLPSLSRAVLALPARTLILDGEMVVANDDGVPEFGLLRTELAAQHSDRLRYVVFDLMFLDGFDLRHAALRDRQRILALLLSDVEPPLQLGRATAADGLQLLASAKRMGLQGLVAKQANSAYRSGPNRTWVKVEFPVA